MWVDEPTGIAGARQGSLWAIVGAAAAMIGSYLPFVSSPLMVGGDVRPEFRHLSATGAVLLLAVALATLRWRHPAVFFVLLLVAFLGAASYAGFIVMGQVGIESEPSPMFAYRTKLTFAPNIGILLCLCGCVAAGAGAVKLVAGSSRP